MIQFLITVFLVIGIFFSFIVYCALANKKPTPSPGQNHGALSPYQPELNYQKRLWCAMSYEKTKNLPAVINSMTDRAPASK
jgi:hypothetical protein